MKRGSTYALVMLAAFLLVGYAQTAFSAENWSGSISLGWGADWSEDDTEAGVHSLLPEVATRLVRSGDGLDTRLSATWRGVGSAVADQKNTIEAGFTYDRPQYRLLGEVNGLTVGENASSEGPYRAVGASASLADLTVSRSPANLETGLKYRRYWYPGREARDFTESGWRFKTVVRLNDEPGALRKYFDPTWLAGLPGLIDAGRPDGEGPEDLPLPEWYLAWETAESWFGEAASEEAMSPEASGSAGEAQALYILTAQREFEVKDYIVDDDTDSGLYTDTVAISEERSNRTTALKYSTTQRDYAGTSSDSYRLSGFTVSAEKPLAGGAAKEEFTRTGDVLAGWDHKEYPYDSDAGYSQLRAGAGLDWRRRVGGLRSVSLSASGRWRREASQSQTKLAFDATAQMRPAWGKVEAGAVLTLWDGTSSDEDYGDRRSLRARLALERPLANGLTLSTSLAAETSVEKENGDWSAPQSAAVGRASLVWRF